MLLQAVKTEFTVKVVRRLRAYDGLTLDEDNAKKVAALLPISQNALVCPQCRMPTIEVAMQVSGLSAAFVTSCGHPIKFDPPVTMFSNRLLPDINILVGNNLSLFLKLGNFRGFEVVVPEFLMHAIDQFLGHAKAKGAAREIEALKEFANRGEISLVLVEMGDKKYINPKDFEAQEDDFILHQAKLTNAILLTADKNLAQKATLQQRPVVFVPPMLIGDLKKLAGEDVGQKQPPV